MAQSAAALSATRTQEILSLRPDAKQELTDLQEAFNKQAAVMKDAATLADAANAVARVRAISNKAQFLYHTAPFPTGGTTEQT